MSGNSVTEFVKRRIVASLELMNEREEVDPILSLAPNAIFTGAQVGITTLERKKRESLLTSQDGKGHSVQPNTKKTKYYDPLWIKPEGQFDSTDEELFAQAALAGPDAASQAAANEADELIDQQIDAVVDEYEVFKAKGVVDAFLGTVKGKLNTGVDITVSYNLSTLTQPSTSWHQAAATIIQDLRSLMREFRTAAGFNPDTVIYEPLTLGEYLSKNTDIIATFDSVDAFMAQYLQISSNPVIGNAFGRFLGLGDLTWIPIDAVYTNRAGTSTEYMDATKLVFMHRGRANPRFRCRYVSTMTPRPGLNIETVGPNDQSNIKTRKVFGYANGLVSFDDTNAVRPVTIKF